MSKFTTHHLLPPFADNVETAPLVSVSLARLQAGDKAEEEAFYKACKDLGFFYLDMNDSELGEGIVKDAEKLHALQQKFFPLSKAEKDEFCREKVDPFFAYRYRELEWNDADGRPARNESYNVRKDDIIGNCERLPAHPMILKNNDLFKSYTIKCRTAIDLMINVLEVKLELPKGTLANLHRIDHRSGDHVRFTSNAISEYDEEAAKQGEHTDFGTLTILFNWLGGLQICVPDNETGGYTDKWVWVKPVPGSAVVNLGDALVRFTSGILRSNIHRVAAPLGAQAGQPRNSLVYFSRPEDDVPLNRLKGGLIDARPHIPGENEGLLSKDWILRRSIGDLKGVYTHTGGMKRRVEPVMNMTPKVQPIQAAGGP